MFRFLSLLFGLSLLSACVEVSGQGTNPPPPPPTTPPVVGQVALGGSWQLVELNGRPESGGITLDLGSDNSATGEAPCNRYFGTYAAGSDFSFSLPQIGATRRACPALNLESEYFAALSAATQYRPGREGDTFALLDAAGRTVASYVRASAPQAQVNIEGSWAITAASINGILTPNPGPTTAGITFSGATREFNANLGCNSASGPFTQNGDQIDFGAIAVTARQCFAPAPLEGPLLAAFPLVQRAVQTATGVDLLDAVGNPLIRLAR